MLSIITLASKKLTIMHYTTALNASIKENDTNYQFKIFFACTIIVSLQSTKNHFVGVALFLAGGNRVGYFLDRPRIVVPKTTFICLFSLLSYHFAGHLPLSPSAEIRQQSQAIKTTSKECLLRLKKQSEITDKAV